jgi:hypothetical protein
MFLLQLENYHPASMRPLKGSHVLLQVQLIRANGPPRLPETPGLSFIRHIITEFSFCRIVFGSDYVLL